MNFRGLFAVLVWSLVVPFLSAQENALFEKTTANLSVSEKELLKEFRQVSQKIQSFYTNVQIEADLSIFQKKGETGGNSSVPKNNELPLVGRSHLAFYVLDGLWSEGDTVKHYYRLDSEDYEKQAFSDLPGKWVSIATPDDSYAISKVSKDIYSLSEQTKTSSQFVSQSFFSCPLVSAPYAHFGITITRWMLEVDDVTIQSVAVDESLPDPVVTVIFDKHYPKGNARYEYRFIKKNGALLYAKKAVGSSNNRVVGFFLHNTYEGEIDGVPLLKQVVYEEFTGNKNAAPETTLRKQYDIIKIVPGAPNLAVFDVQQFLPAIGRATRFNYLRVFFMVAGAALVFFAIYLKCYGK